MNGVFAYDVGKAITQAGKQAKGKKPANRCGLRAIGLVYRRVKKPPDQASETTVLIKVIRPNARGARRLHRKPP